MVQEWLACTRSELKDAHPPEARPKRGLLEIECAQTQTDDLRAGIDEYERIRRGTRGRYATAGKVTLDDLSGQPIRDRGLFLLW